MTTSLTANISNKSGEQKKSFKPELQSSIDGTITKVQKSESATGNTLSESKEEPKIVRLKRYLEKYDFRLDIVGNELEFRTRRPPGQEELFTTLNENSLSVELYTAGFLGFEKQLMALMRSDYVLSYNPIQHYFEGLPKWDESKPDYIGQLAGFVKACNQEWFAAQYRKMLVRTVACGIGEIAFNKQCMVFVGFQDDGKSSFIRFHVPKPLEKYYTEHIEFDSKDGKIALCENFLINLDELADFSKVDINKAKAYFTEDTIKVRRPFASRPTRDKRRASFFGSTNQNNFLTDETGNVRWLIIEINKNGINHDSGGPSGYSRNVDIDLVWSQAYALLKSGFAFQMTRQEIEQSEQHNRQHMQNTTERELIIKHVQPAEPKAPGAEFMMAGEIERELARYYENKVKINANNIGKALRSLGFPLISGRRDDCTYPIQAYWVTLFSNPQISKKN
ncbi:hypothetical protein EXU85_22665 [Spirosoma sp. KCTC 42546]|uniref:VapE domain-containing protein n=1 Tax=Spirosoma sp. KCTC 42546 TaxID=2520506 RepID=UPI0011570D93|nr:VapE domain-containing protein [Spirosoma sp. KCTC 42546]QDK81259.1 hypothetical protein EXU85_22665 [Spirosoma sp. KCTC 42546]